MALGYDAKGNLTASGSDSFGYDHLNRMVSASTGNGSASLGYDPMDRLYRTAGSVATRFLHDGADLIAEYGDNGAVLRRYVHGLSDDEPLLWYEGSGTGDRRWLTADERGSIVSVTNGSGGAIAVNSYDGWGIPSGTNLGRFQYTGQMWLPEIGMYQYKARAYSPNLGSFYSQTHSDMTIRSIFTHMWQMIPSTRQILMVRRACCNGSAKVRQQ